METIQSEESEDIVICTSRRGILPMLIISIISGIFFFVFLILASISFIFFSDQRSGGTIGAILVFLGFAALSLWSIRSTRDLARPGTPMLVMNH